MLFISSFLTTIILIGLPIAFFFFFWSYWVGEQVKQTIICIFPFSCYCQILELLVSLLLQRKRKKEGGLLSIYWFLDLILEFLYQYNFLVFTFLISPLTSWIYLFSLSLSFSFLSNLMFLFVVYAASIHKAYVRPIFTFEKKAQQQEHGLQTAVTVKIFVWFFFIMVAHCYALVHSIIYKQCWISFFGMCVGYSGNYIMIRDRLSDLVLTRVSQAQRCIREFFLNLCFGKTSNVHHLSKLQKK